MTISRRQLLRLGGASATGLAFGGLGGCSPIFRSPDLEPYVAELRRLELSPVGSSIRVHGATHRFHPGLPRAETFAMNGQSFGGPRFGAVAGTPTHSWIHNDLGDHPLRASLDTTVPGTLPSDGDSPRVSMHLHGGVTPAEFDGHPMDTSFQGKAIDMNGRMCKRPAHCGFMTTPMASRASMFTLDSSLPTTFATSSTQGPLRTRSGCPPANLNFRCPCRIAASTNTEMCDFAPSHLSQRVLGREG